MDSVIVLIRNGMIDSEGFNRINVLFGFFEVENIIGRV